MPPLIPGIDDMSGVGVALGLIPMPGMDDISGVGVEDGVGVGVA
jgi:hypothetical protein